MPALNNLAGVYFAEQDFGQAKEVCIKILEINPKAVVPMINLGKAYYMLKQDNQARDTWQKAKVLAPERTDIDGFLKMLSKNK